MPNPASGATPQVIVHQPKKVAIHQPNIGSNRPDGSLPPSHPILNRTFPFLCEVCKSRDATTCSACKSVSYCGRACQKRGWASHKRVCKVFQQLHQTGDGLSQTDVREHFHGSARAARTYVEMRYARDMFCALHKKEPGMLEGEQLSRFPRCNVCGRSACQKSGAVADGVDGVSVGGLGQGLIPCSLCRCVAYCSKECEQKDAVHVRGGQLCRKLVGTSMAVKVVSEQQGARPGFCSRGGTTCDLLRCGDVDALAKIHSENAGEKAAEKSEEAGSCTAKDCIVRTENGKETLSLKGDPRVVPAHMLPWLAYIQSVDFGIEAGGPIPGDVDRRDIPLLDMVDGLICAVLDGLSQQLSVLYAVAKLEDALKAKEAIGSGAGPKAAESLLSGEVVIHVIGAEAEFSGFFAWEEALHRYPEIDTLRVVLVGPGTMVDLREEMEVGKGDVGRKLCEFCTTKRFFLSSVRDTYEKYVESEHYQTPTICVAFNAGCHDVATGIRSSPEGSSTTNDTPLISAWTPALQYLAKNSPAPLILTGFDTNECLLDVEVCQRVAEACGTTFRVLLEPYDNPFASPLWKQEPGWGAVVEGGAVAFTENACVAVLAGEKCGLGVAECGLAVAS